MPAGAQGLVLIPPAANTVGLTLKGAGGDTGTALSPSNPSVLALASSVTQVLVVAAGAISGAVEASFF